MPDDAKPDPGRPEDARKVPSHELTYVRLRDMVLFGALAPGQPVTIQGLITDLGAGMNFDASQKSGHMGYQSGQNDKIMHV